MSGHSKWATIKHKKGKADAARGRIFTRLIKEITIAARMGGGDTEANPRLRQAVLTAKAQNMPSDNIERAIKKGTGELEGVSYEEITYEAYGPGGTAIIIDCTTDNKNRCVAEIRRIVSKSGGNMATQNAVAWNFRMAGVIEVEGEDLDEDTVMMAALEAGAEDVEGGDGLFEITTEPSELNEVADKLRDAGLNVTSTKNAKLPNSTVKLTGKEAEQMLRLMENLEDSDDVQNVWANFDIDDEEMEALAG